MAIGVASLGRWVGRRVAAAVKYFTGATRRRVRGAYDAAQDDDDNRAHWQWADALNANAANSPEVRRVLRERARYERDNNGHCGGLTEKIARDLIGTGPRAQLTLPATWADPDFGVEQTTPDGAARAVERLYGAWCRAVGWGRKLRTLAEARPVDGEGFGVMVTNPALPATAPQLDVRLYETDQFSTPFYDWSDPLAFDGGRLDEAGNVVEWHLLKTHPGSAVWVANYLDYDRVPAARVIHWYKARRAGQLRGVPEILAALPLFAYLRRLTLASVAAAELAANYAAVLTTDLPPPATGTDAPEDAAFDLIPTPRKGMATLPAGYDLKQLEAKHPAAGYHDLKADILTETGATAGAPRNVATGSSAEYNYSSGRLDHLPYERMIVVLRSDLREVALDPVFRAWYAEARLIPGYLPEGLPPLDLWSWEWHFDGFDSIDPLKDATTDETELRINTTTLAEIYARKGKDWEEAVRQRAREQDVLNELGLTSVMAMTVTPGVAPRPGADGEDATAGQAAASAGGVQSTALNGAQITSLLALADKVVLKLYPADAAKALVQAAFPLMSKQLIARFVDGLVAAPTPAAPAQEAAHAEPAAAA